MLKPCASAPSSSWIAAQVITCAGRHGERSRNEFPAVSIGWITVEFGIRLGACSLRLNRTPFVGWAKSLTVLCPRGQPRASDFAHAESVDRAVAHPTDRIRAESV